MYNALDIEDLKIRKLSWVGHMWKQKTGWLVRLQFGRQMELDQEDIQDNGDVIKLEKNLSTVEVA